MVVKDHGQPQGEVIEGIKVWKTFKEHEGVPVFRFVYPRMTSVVAALKKADADIYYQSCAGSLTGIVANYCIRNNKKFIFRLAHDSDCIPGEQLINLWRDKKIYEYGLRRTTLIAAQGVKQVELLKQHYLLESIPVNMAVQLPEKKSDVDKTIDILWVNNYRDFKRPELVPDLAKLLPQFKITMIGGPVPGNEALFDEVKKQSNAIDNLTVTGAIPYHTVNDFFIKSKIFINTSDWEGFPNSFLQAWIRGVPIVSFFDPDNLIAKRQLGAVPKNLAAMADDLKRLLTDDVTRQAMAMSAQEYVLENYAPINVARHYETLLMS